MTWSDFKTEVLGFLPLDASRASAGNLIAQLTKSAALDLVSHYPALYSEVETRYAATQGDRVQNGILFSLTPGAKLLSAKIALQFTGVEDVSAVIVDGAGSSGTDGRYPPTGDLLNGRPHYYLDGVVDVSSRHLYWTGTAWVIDQLFSTLYTGTAEATPWLAAWSVTDGDSPAPSITESPTPLSPGDGIDDSFNDSWQGALTVVPWSQRFVVVSGECGVAAYDEPSGKFLAPFFEEASQALVITIPGRPAGWVDGDAVSFNTRDAECVAAYVQAHIARTIDKNPRLADAHETRFRQLRRARAVDLKGN